MLYPLAFSRTVNALPAEQVSVIKYFMQVGPVGLLKLDRRGICLFMALDFMRAASQGSMTQWVYHIGNIFGQLGGFGIPCLKSTPGFLRRQRNCFDDPNLIFTDPLFTQSCGAPQIQINREHIPYNSQFMSYCLGLGVFELPNSEELIIRFLEIAESFFRNNTAPNPATGRRNNGINFHKKTFESRRTIHSFSPMCRGEVACYSVSFRMKPRANQEHLGMLHAISFCLYSPLNPSENSRIYVMDSNIGLFCINNYEGARSFIRAFIDQFYGGKVLSDITVCEQPLFWFSDAVMKNAELQVTDRQANGARYMKLEHDLYTTNPAYGARSLVDRTCSVASAAWSFVPAMPRFWGATKPPASVLGEPTLILSDGFSSDEEGDKPLRSPRRESQSDVPGRDAASAAEFLSRSTVGYAADCEIDTTPALLATSCRPR